MKHILHNIWLLIFIATLNISSLASEDPSLRVYHISNDEVRLDGKLTEEVWSKADSITDFKMVEPEEGALPSFPSIVKVLASDKKLIIGVICRDPEPDKIVCFSKARDRRMWSEDNIRFVLDTFLDGRNGYIFGINPLGARYDALVTGFGEHENSNWDTYWDAKTSINKNGWSAEILIPVTNLSFKNNSTSWGFNIERNIQRYLEKDRWTGISQDYNLGHVIHAGKLTNLPRFKLGYGLIPRFYFLSDLVANRGSGFESRLDGSFDLVKKFGSGITAQITINTDFAETEVDERRTNLTRFPLFFPEKRAFFLEGADIFSFGVGLGRDVLPFHSRRIGLYDNEEVPIIAGIKLNGRINNTNFGLLGTATDEVKGLVPASQMGVFRIKQNILKESYMGVIGTVGDPENKGSSWLLGTDLVFKTSSFMNGKNFLVGFWGLLNHSPEFRDKKYAGGIKIDYPNDLLDMSLIYRYVDRDFNPALGFIKRAGERYYRIGSSFMPRPKKGFIRQLFFRSSVSTYTDIKTGQWNSYYVFLTPLNILFESGDRIEFQIHRQGERIGEGEGDFLPEIIISPGKYSWTKYRLELGTSFKRPLQCEVDYSKGGYYTGNITEYGIDVTLRANHSLNFSIENEHEIVNIDDKSIQNVIYRARINLNFTPNFQISSFIQYDNDSKSIGSNTRLRWTFSMYGDLYIVYNHNIEHPADDQWLFHSNQLIIKVSYGLSL